MTEIFKLADYLEDLTSLDKCGLPRGPNPGWDELDQHYRPACGYMTTVTGIPMHGKSEVIDAIMVNLAWQYGWKFAIYSPENFPISFHVTKLTEKFVGLNSRDIASSGKKDARLWIDEHFTFVYPQEDQSTLLDILALFDQIKNTYGLNGILIDPWNEIDHRRPEGLTETEYISQALTKIRRFSREKEVHAWIVAHPAKLQKNKEGKYDPPTPYDISGSAHWRNKSDFCLTIHRDDLTREEVSVIVNKVKFKHFGKIGEVKMYYDPKSGRMRDIGSIGFKLPEKKA